jgi:hypothetical protein
MLANNIATASENMSTQHSHGGLYQSLLSTSTANESVDHIAWQGKDNVETVKTRSVVKISSEFTGISI